MTNKCIDSNPNETCSTGRITLGRCNKHYLRHNHKGKLYNSWRGMKQRCLNPNNEDFSHYGEKGVTVYGEWLSFEGFKKWALAAGYQEGLSIERNDTNGPYSPENCRWIPKSEQTRNYSRNTHLILFGESKIIVEWSEDPRCEVSYEAIIQRIYKQGWEVSERVILRGSWRPVICDCGTEFQAQNDRAKYCSDKCRKDAWRLKQQKT